MVKIYTFLLSVSLISGCVNKDNVETDKSETTNREEKILKKLREKMKIIKENQRKMKK